MRLRSDSEALARTDHVGEQYKILASTCFCCSLIVNPLALTVAIRVQLLKHLVPDRIKPLFVIFDTRAL